MSMSDVEPDSIISVEFKRGTKKENHGEIPAAKANSEGIVIWKDQNISLNCTLFKDGVLYESKSIMFALKEVLLFVVVAISVYFFWFTVFLSYIYIY